MIKKDVELLLAALRYVVIQNIDAANKYANGDVGIIFHRAISDGDLGVYKLNKNHVEH